MSKKNKEKLKLSRFFLFPGLALLAFTNITWLITGGIDGNNTWLDPFMMVGMTLTIIGVIMLVFRGDW